MVLFVGSHELLLLDNKTIILELNGHLLLCCCIFTSCLISEGYLADGCGSYATFSIIVHISKSAHIFGDILVYNNIWIVIIVFH